MRYHKSIDTISHYNFMMLRKHNDVRYLLELDSYLDIDKYKTDERHLKAYADIMNEYNDELLKRERIAYLFDIEKNISQLEAERLLCQLLLSQIKIFKDSEDFKDIVEKCITELDNLGYSYNGNIEALEGQIDSILNEIDDLELAKNSNSNKNSVTHEEMIDAIEQYRKVPINAAEITERQYLTYENGYLKYLASLKNKK